MTTFIFDDNGDICEAGDDFLEPPETSEFTGLAEAINRMLLWQTGRLPESKLLETIDPHFGVIELDVPSRNAISWSQADYVTGSRYSRLLSDNACLFSH